MEKIFEYLFQHKEWIFSGVGTTLLGCLLSIFFTRKRDETDKGNTYKLRTNSIKNFFIIVVFLFAVLIFQAYFNGDNSEINLTDKKTSTIYEVDQDEFERKSDPWTNIKINLIIGNYEKVIKIAELNDLLETEDMLNIIGVMYANGYFYEQDYDKAIDYFHAATCLGKSKNTYINLLIVSYIADLKELEEGSAFPYSRTIEAFSIGQKNNNKDLNEILQIMIAVNKDIRSIDIKDGYEYFNNLSDYEQKEILDSISAKYKDIKILQCEKLDYYYDDDGELRAMCAKIVEKVIPIIIFITIPNEYCLMDEFTIISETNPESYISAEFEYSPIYYDEKGEPHFWIDTDEYFNGDIPPADADNYRWVISSIDEKNQNQRIFRKQIMADYT